MASCRLASASVLWTFSSNTTDIALTALSGSPGPPPDAWCAPAARQDLRQMHGAHRQRGARQRPLYLHQATGIRADHCLGAGAHDGIDLGARHAAGDFGEFDRERAAESAAFLGRVHLAQFQSANVRQQTAGAVLDAEFAQRMTTVVI